MKIAIIGYGKMGRAIEHHALLDGHEIVLKIDHDTQELLSPEHLQKADVAIEFSRPESAVNNIKSCIEAGLPIVSGTTGWLAHYEELKALCEAKNSAFFYASNYSIGVNIFFEINKQLAKVMDQYATYDIKMEEIHHTQKLDAPSGTAITLAQGILEKISRKQQWVNEFSGQDEDLSIISKRIDKVPGTHSIQYQSEIDEIEIKHTAHSRDGFAKGAVLAAAWLVDKKGVFGMKDMLGLG